MANFNEIEHNERKIQQWGEKLDQAIAEGNDEAAALYEEVWAEMARHNHALKEQAEREESEAPRRAAEARLRYHVENDTLDLY